MVVGLEGLQVLGQLVDALGEQGNLDLGRAGIALVKPVPLDEGCLLTDGKRHLRGLRLPEPVARGKDSPRDRPRTNFHPFRVGPKGAMLGLTGSAANGKGSYPVASKAQSPTPAATTVILAVCPLSNEPPWPDVHELIPPG